MHERAPPESEEGEQPPAALEQLWLLLHSKGIEGQAVRYFGPPYAGKGLALCRGQESGEPYAIAWTSRYEMAAGQFSAGRTSPIVLAVCATPEMIVAHVQDPVSTPKTNAQSDLEYEDEYLLDPRLLAGKVGIVKDPEG